MCTRNGVPRHRSGGLREPVDLRHLDAERPEEPQHLLRDRRGAAERGLDLVEPEQRPHEVEDGLDRSRAPRPARRRAPRPGARASAATVADRDRGVERGLLRRVGASDGEHTGVELLPDAGDAEEDLGTHLGEVRADLGGLGAAGDLEAGDEALVVGRQPLRDVRHRQVRHEPAEAGIGLVPGPAGEEAVDGPARCWRGRASRPWGAGRARRVDDRSRGRRACAVCAATSRSSGSDVEERIPRAARRPARRRRRR